MMETNRTLRRTVANNYCNFYAQAVREVANKTTLRVFVR